MSRSKLARLAVFGMGFPGSDGGGGRLEEEGIAEEVGDDFLRICGRGGGAGLAVARRKRVSAALRVGVSGSFVAFVAGGVEGRFLGAGSASRSSSSESSVLEEARAGALFCVLGLGLRSKGFAL